MLELTRFRSITPHGAAIRAVRTFLGIPRRRLAKAACLSEERLRLIELWVASGDPEELRQVWTVLVDEDPTAHWKDRAEERP